MNAETLDAMGSVMVWYEGTTPPTGDDPGAWVSVRYWEPPGWEEDMMEAMFRADTREDGYGN